MHRTKTAKKVRAPLDVIKTLVIEGRLDEDTARLLNSIMVQAANVRNAIRNIGENYRAILDSCATVRGNLDVVLDNVSDVRNYAEDDDDED